MKKCFASYGFSFANTTQTTREIENARSVIDHVIFNKQNRKLSIKFSSSSLTDHNIQEVVVKAIDETSKKISKHIKYLHYEGFKNSLTAKISSTNIKSFNELIKLILEEKQLFTKTRILKREVMSGLILSLLPCLQRGINFMLN